MPQLTKACRNCAKPFPVKPSHYDKKSYCSRQCMAEDYRSRLTGAENPNHRGAGWRACRRCGKQFKSYDTQRKYCSHRCSYLPRQPQQPTLPFRVPRLCRSCGKPSPHRRFCKDCSPRGKRKFIFSCVTCGAQFAGHKYKGMERRFCSRACYAPAVAARQKGERSHLWQGGKTNAATLLRGSAEYKAWRKAVFARDDWTCQLCHQRGKKLAAHHIIEFAKRRDLALIVENGITLCWSCHHSIHHHEEEYEAQFLAITGGSF